MRIRNTIVLASIFLLATLLAGCASAAATHRAPEAPAEGGYEVPAAATQAPAPTMAAQADSAAGSNVPKQANIAAQSAGYGSQMVIKNGEMRLQVKDTEQALDGVTQIVGDVHGYTISSRVWFQDYYGTNYKYATLTIGVPVDQFEAAQRRLRSLAVRVLDDNASGQDVTDQYTDLQSQLTNLQATRDRIKSFLDNARTVDEALQINQQLSDVEGQIEKIKGQMNYLSSRSAVSTLTINIEPQLPDITPTPTATATATPSPTPVVVQPLGPWDPGQTTQRASNTLISAYRVIVDILIWVALVLLPIFGPPVLLVWLAIWFIRRRTRAAAKA